MLRRKFTQVYKLLFILLIYIKSNLYIGITLRQGKKVDSRSSTVSAGAFLLDVKLYSQSSVENHFDKGYPKQDLWKTAQMQTRMWISPNTQSQSICEAYAVLQDRIYDYWDEVKWEQLREEREKKKALQNL